MTSSPERLRSLGALTELREKLRANTNRISGIRGSLNEAAWCVDPEDPYVIDGQKIRDFANELYEALEYGLKIKSQIAKLEADLGV